MKLRDFSRIFLFVLIFLLLNSSLSSIYVRFSRSNKIYELNRHDFEQVQDQITLVILGDSHAAYSVQAGKIEGAFNFATLGELYMDTYYKVKYYLDNGHFNPQVAVISVDMHLFSSYRNKNIYSQDPAFWGQYVNYFSVGLETGTLTDMLPTIALSHLGLAGGMDRTIKILFFSGYGDIYHLDSGFLAADRILSVETKQERAQLQADEVFVSGSYMDDLAIGYFLRLIDLLDAHDVQVVFIQYPVTDYYYEAASADIPVEAHLSSVQTLLGDRQPALFLDYHDLFFGQQDYFFDSDHLNVTGAEIFTDILIEDLTEAGVLPVSPSN